MQNSSSRFSIKLLSIALSSTLLLTACGSDDDDDVSDVIESPVAVSSLKGTIVDSDSLEPIPNATIQFGDQTIQATNEGAFAITDLGIDQDVTITIEAEGYPTREFVTTVSGNNPMEVEYQLNNDDTIATVTAPATQEIQVAVDGYGSRVVIPANTLRRMDGQPIVGVVDVTIDAILPAIDAEEMPGNYQTIDGEYIESFGAVVITAIDAEGNTLELTEGSLASIIIPVSTRSSTENLAQIMPLYYFDTVADAWVAQGEATLISLDDGQDAYTAEVPMIGTWNVDVPFNTVGVAGCVADTEGNRIANATVKGDGINYSSITTSFTNANGDFILPARENSELYVYSQNGNRNSNAVSVTTGTTDTSLGNNCLTVSTENDSLSIRLTWGELPYDVDSYLITPSGDVVNYINPGSLYSAPFANLDVDDTDSYGPEFITVRNLMVGRYQYAVDNYSETKNPGLKDSPISVLLEGPTIRSRVLAPTENDKDNEDFLWYAFDVIVDEQCNITFESIDKWLNYEEADVELDMNAATTPQYCVIP